MAASREGVGTVVGNVAEMLVRIGDQIPESGEPPEVAGILPRDAAVRFHPPGRRSPIILPSVETRCRLPAGISWEPAEAPYSVKTHHLQEHPSFCFQKPRPCRRDSLLLHDFQGDVHPDQEVRPAALQRIPREGRTSPGHSGPPPPVRCKR